MTTRSSSPNQFESMFSLMDPQAVASMLARAEESAVPRRQINRLSDEDALPATVESAHRPVVARAGRLDPQTKARLLAPKRLPAATEMAGVLWG